MGKCSLHADPLAGSLGQVNLDSDKWKLWKNLFELIEKKFNLAFLQVGEKIKAKTVNVQSNVPIYLMSHL